MYLQFINVRNYYFNASKDEQLIFMINQQKLKEFIISSASNKPFLIGLTITTVSFLAIFIYVQYQKIYPSTNNAYVNAYLITVTPKINGTIKRICVKNNQYVHAGDLLLELDAVDYDALLQQSHIDVLMATQAALTAKQQVTNAQADVTKAQSNLEYSKQMAKRYTNLFQHQAASKQIMQKFINDHNIAVQVADQAKTVTQQAQVQYKMAQAKIKLANVELKNAKLTNSYTKLYAPVNGYISDMNLQTGTLVLAGQKLFGLIDSSSWWIDANFKETQLRRIKPNQKALITLDLYSHSYQGEVQSISYSSGNTFSLLPAENATGNWVKVTQRFTVRIALKNDPKYPLRVGASANVTVNTH